MRMDRGSGPEDIERHGKEERYRFLNRENRLSTSVGGGALNATMKRKENVLVACFRVDVSRKEGSEGAQIFVRIRRAIQNERMLKISGRKKAVCVSDKEHLRNLGCYDIEVPQRKLNMRSTDWKKSGEGEKKKEGEGPTLPSLLSTREKTGKLS